jgi:hypothetical protein
MKKLFVFGGLGAIFACALASVNAHAPSGAIFTTLPDGSEVNYNIYASKLDVYLDGGPGKQAPIDAAGLDEGDYVFQVTDPSGKVLLSTDAARCRQFQVNANGVIAVLTGGPADSCVSEGLALGADGNHRQGVDADHGSEGAVTVQLMPYLNTPNPGGEYKAWVTRLDDFLLGCQELGFAGSTGLDVVDCGGKTRGNAHGFIPRHSKTDNFKVGGAAREIDTRFHAGHLYGEYIDGPGITWTDTLGATNQKWAYLDVALDINHEAHVEAVENGTHLITVENQPGCTIGQIAVDGSVLRKAGPQTIAISVKPSFKFGTIFVDVECVD